MIHNSSFFTTWRNSGLGNSKIYVDYVTWRFYISDLMLIVYVPYKHLWIFLSEVLLFQIISLCWFVDSNKYATEPIADNLYYHIFSREIHEFYPLKKRDIFTSCYFPISKRIIFTDRKQAILTSYHVLHGVNNIWEKCVVGLTERSTF